MNSKILLIGTMLVTLALAGCGSDDSSTEMTPTDTETTTETQPSRSSIDDVKSPVEVAKALEKAGAIDDYESDVLPDTGEIPGFKSSVVVEARDTGFSIELYESRGARKKETAAQKSFAKNGKLSQADCGIILVRIPSIIPEKQSTYKAITEDIQEALRDTYRDC